MEELGFKPENERERWLPESLHEALTDAVDACGFRDLDSDHNWWGADSDIIYYPLSVGVDVIQAAGNREIHFAYLWDDRCTTLVFFGDIEKVQSRNRLLLPMTTKTNPISY